MSDDSVWRIDEWAELDRFFRPRVLTGHIQNLDAAAQYFATSYEAPAPDETGGMTLDELLGDIDTLIGDDDA